MLRFGAKDRSERFSLSREDLLRGSNFHDYDFSSAVESYSAQKMNDDDVPLIPVYNRESNRINRFSKPSVPSSEHSLYTDLQPSTPRYIERPPTPQKGELPELPSENDYNLGDHFKVPEPVQHNTSCPAMSHFGANEGVSTKTGKRGPRRKPPVHGAEMQPLSLPRVRNKSVLRRKPLPEIATQAPPNQSTTGTFDPRGKRSPRKLNFHTEETVPTFTPFQPTFVPISPVHSKTPPMQVNGPDQSLPRSKDSSMFENELSSSSATTIESISVRALVVESLLPWDLPSYYENGAAVSVEEVDSLFDPPAEAQRPAVPSKDNLAVHEDPPCIEVHSPTPMSSPVFRQYNYDKRKTSSTSSTRSTSSSVPRIDFCLDLCADYDTSRFMIPEQNRVPNAHQISKRQMHHISLPQRPAVSTAPEADRRASHRFTKIIKGVFT